MKKSLVVLLLAATASLSAWSQGTPPAPKVVGKLINVEGLVTVSAGQSLANAVNGAKLVVGNRIITTSSGAVTLNFDNGCDVNLGPNQAITVRESNDCAALLAGVTPVGGLAVVPVAAAGSGLLVPGLILAGGAIAIVGSNNSSKNNSPN